MKDSLTIGSRGSKLALRQAEWVMSRLSRLNPGINISIEIIKTSGDVLKDAPLSIIGGKGVFTKELEEALLDGRIDLAVHSLKDLPTTLPEGLSIPAITEREDARDALVLRPSKTKNPSRIKELPDSAIVGTSSLRRTSQIKYTRPDLVIKDLRGNVDTRLRKLDAGEYDCVVLACAGLHRLGLSHRINAIIEPDEILPAVGQGALAIETRAADDRVTKLLFPLDHAGTRAACTAERALLRALGGGCQLPIAAHAACAGENRLRLEALVAEPEGKTIVRGALEDENSRASQLGEELAKRLLRRGAASLLPSVVK